MCVFSTTPAHLHKFHLMQLIANITVTPQVSYISNLYSLNIWRTEFNLDSIKNTFCYDHLLNIFGGEGVGLDLVSTIQNLYTACTKMYCGNCKEVSVKHYTFTSYNVQLNVNLDNSQLDRMFLLGMMLSWYK